MLYCLCRWDGYGVIGCSERDYERLQCTSPVNSTAMAMVNLTEQACGGTRSQTFPTGGHVLLFLGLGDKLPGPAQEIRGEAAKAYTNGGRDWFRLCCAVAAFRLLGLLGCFIKARPKKSATKTSTVDAAAEVEAMVQGSTGVFPQYLGACRRQTPRTRVDL